MIRYMLFAEAVILSFTLAIDATAVSATNGLCYTKLSKKRMLLASLMFGVFQAAMPLIGYLMMSLSALNENVNNFVMLLDHWVALALLGFLGGKMIIDAIKEIKFDKKLKNASEEEKAQLLNTEDAPKEEDIKIRTIFVQAFATSIDAFAVGISMYAAGSTENAKGYINMLWAFAIIGVSTFLLSVLGHLFGKGIGAVVKKIAPIIGGLVLIAIGLSIVLEHQFGIGF